MVRKGQYAAKAKVSKVMVASLVATETMVSGLMVSGAVSVETMG